MQSPNGVLSLTVGQRLGCPVCDTELIVIRPPNRGLRLACGGSSLTDVSASRPGGGHPQAVGDGVQLGKRYIDEGSGLELLCTKPGTGAVTCEGAALSIKIARPLPSSD
jgi:hypothetical protein